MLSIWYKRFVMSYFAYILVAHPTKRARVAQGLFEGGPTLDRSPDTPGIPKNTSGSDGIPLNIGIFSFRR